MGTRILIVDDETMFAELMKERLEEDGFEVHYASNGLEFESKLRSNERPDIIILDILLGSEDGPGLYAKFSAKGLVEGIPVIFLSSLANDRPQSEVYEGRVYQLRSKNFPANQLVEDIRRMVPG